MSQQYREEDLVQYNHSLLDFFYESICRQEESVEYISPELYSEADGEDFHEIEAVYMDHSAFMDALENITRVGPLGYDHSVDSEKVLRLIDSVLTLDAERDRDVALKYPNNLHYTEMVERKGMGDEFELLKNLGEPFTRCEDSKAQSYEHMVHDAAIARRAETADEDNIIVTTDADFARLEDEFDIKVYPPDVAELGITTQI